MSVGTSYGLDVKQTTADNGGIGTEKAVGDLTLMTIQLATSGGTGTVQFEGTIDGSNWFALGAAVTVAGAFNVPFNKLSRVRARTTVNVAAGPFSAQIAGFMTRGE